MIDTSELGAGNNPTPTERKPRKVKVEMTVVYCVEDEFPEDWTNNDIKEYIHENTSEYSYNGEILEIELRG